MALDPNHPVDASGPDQVFGTDPGLTGHVPSERFVDTENVFADAPVLAPVQGNPATVTTGGTLAAATYYYVITATGQGLNQQGESTKSNEKSQATSGSTSKVTLTWTPSNKAGGYKIYRSVSSGTEVLLATVTGGATSTFVDDGTLTPGTATPPTVGTAKSYQATDFSASTLDTHGYDAGYNLGVQEITTNSATITDFVTTNTSATVTSASKAFTQGMRDLPVRATGVPQGTRIFNVATDGGSATLTAAATASATVTAVVGGVPTLDQLGYGSVYFPAGPNVNTDQTQSGYTINAQDTTNTYGASVSQQSAMNSKTYGQSLVTGAVDQQFGSQSNYPGTAGPGASGGVFTDQGSGKVGANTANPLTGVPDTLGNTGGASTTTAGVPNPTTYSQTVGDQVGNNQVVNGVNLFRPDGFQNKNTTGERDTSNTMYQRVAGVNLLPNTGTVTTLPSGYTLSTYDTLNGYTGIAPGASGTAPTMPQNVSWAFGAGCAVVNWTAPSSNGGNNVREYIVEGFQVRDPSYIPATRTQADAFIMEPSVTWRGQGGYFLANPVLNAITASGTGGTLSAATRYYQITALGTYGETLGSNEVSVTNTGTTSSNPLTWAAVTGAVSYNVYRGTASGGEVLIKNVSGTSYTDTGADAPGTQVPPISGSAVAQGYAARVEHLTPGNYYFFRVYARNDVGTSPMSDPGTGPSSPNNTPKYFMGYGMSGVSNTEINEASLIAAEFAADSIR